MLKVLIVNNEVNLGVEKGTGENTLKFTIFKDLQASDPCAIEVNREELNRVISFVMGDDLPLPLPQTDSFPLPLPNLPLLTEPT